MANGVFVNSNRYMLNISNKREREREREREKEREREREDKQTDYTTFVV